MSFYDRILFAFAALLILVGPPATAFAQDTDGDGMPDSHEAVYSCLMGNTADADADPDTDEMTNLSEYLYSPLLSPCLADTDGDGLTDREEVVLYFCNPLDPDSDDDGLNDGDEILYNADPNLADSDEDLLSDGDEVHIYGTLPWAPDYDGDNLDDGFEVFTSLTDPTVSDTDGDGLQDDEEYFGITDPLDPDTDGDGMDDGYEVDSGCLNPIVDDTTLDGDGDGIGNGAEYARGLLPCVADSDGDGVDDGIEDAAGSNPLNPVIVPGLFALEEPYMISPAGADAYSPVIAWGGSVYGIAWYDTRNGTIQVYLQRRDSDGATLGPDLRLAQDPESSALSPSIVYADSLFAVTWIDEHEFNRDVLFARVTDGGTELAPRGRLLAPYAWRNEPQLAWTGSEFGVTYFDDRNGYHDIFLSRFGVDGSTVAPEATLVSGGVNHIYDMIAWDGTGYGLAWVDDYGGANTQVLFRRASAAGVMLGSTLEVNTSDFNQYPDLAWNGTEFGMTYQSFSVVNGTRFVRISAAGEKIGPDLYPVADWTYNTDLIWNPDLSAWSMAGNRSMDWGMGLTVSVFNTAGRSIMKEFAVEVPGLDLNDPALIWDGKHFGVVSSAFDGSQSSIWFFRLETDADGDGLGRDDETAAGTSADNWDTDGDLMSDGYETSNPCLNPLVGNSTGDSDGDGIANLTEFNLGANPCDPDTDTDGMPDGYEFAHRSCGLDLFEYEDAALDFDYDDLTNLEEFGLSTNPCLFDTDSDGLNDGWEVHFYSTNPLLADTDADGMGDEYEVNQLCLDPLTGDSLVDGDTDGLTNFDEFNYPGYLEPCNPDSDGDNLEDGFEANTSGTLPYQEDTDNDGMGDGFEWTYRACVDRFAPDAAADPDGDGLSNLSEHSNNLNPCVADTDGDGLNDYYERNTSLTDPLLADTDGDGLSDGEEVNAVFTDPLLADTDGDGVDDGIEHAAGSDPFSDQITPGLVVSDERRVGAGLAAGRPSLVYNGAGYGLAWVSNDHVRFVRLEMDGDTVDAGIQVSTPSSQSPSLAWTGSEYGLAWSDVRLGDDGVFFSVISSAGVKVSSDLRVSSATPSDSPALAAAGDDFGLIWAQHAGTHRLMFQRINADGTADGSSVMSYSNTAWLGQTSLVFGGTEFAAAFSVDSSIVGLKSIRLNLLGGNKGELFAISSSQEALNPAMAFGNNRYAMVFELENFFGGLYGTVIGTLPPYQYVYNTAKILPAAPAVTAAGNNFGLCYEDVTNNLEIFCRAFTDAGRTIARDVRVTNMSGASRLPSLAWTGSEFGLAWLDQRNAGSEIYFARLAFDADGDGLSQQDETAAGSNPADWDTDEDGLPDGIEVHTYGSSPINPDTDGDGLDDGREVNETNSDPTLADTDADGFDDGDEIDIYHTDPANPDSDGDGLLDGEEVDFYGSNPLVADSDGDGLTDFDEVNVWHSNPWAYDSDGDGVADSTEVLFLHTDPSNPDSDGDGYSDGEEYYNLHTPPGTSNADGDSLPETYERLHPCLDPNTNDGGLDPDLDGRTNLQEYAAGSDPCDPDTDHDGLCDGSAAVGVTCVAGELTRGTSPFAADTDGDGVSDLVENNTGIYQDPAHSGTDPLVADTDGDGYSDGAEVTALTDPTDYLSFPASPTRLVSFQGRLTDSAGMPVNGVVAMTFGIYAAPTGGTRLWYEDQAVTVANGIYNVLLGGVRPLDPDTIAAAAGGERYLEVRVAGEALVPRTAISAVPTAMFADRLMAGRLETDLRPVAVDASGVATLRVSFKKSFVAPPRVVVSFTGLEAVGTLDNVTSDGFDLRVRLLSANPDSGSFTYMAFGN